MKLRTLVLGVVACGLAFGARRLLRDPIEPEPVPVAAPARDARMLAEVAKVVRVDRAEQMIEPLEESEVSDEPEDLIAEERADNLAVLAAALDNSHGAIVGQMHDLRTGEVLAGVTIIVSSPMLPDSQAAISDENGYYEVSNLPLGEYVATFYYLDVTVERAGIVVGGGKLTPVFQQLDYNSHPHYPIVITLDEAPSFDVIGVSFTGTTSSDNHYVIDGEE